MRNVVDGKTYLKFRIRGNRIFLSTEEKRFFVLFLIIAIFRFGYMGYSYAPFLDDYVQYGLYPNLDNVKDSVFFGGAKTIYTRPFATLTDIYVIGTFGLGGLGIAMFVLNILYAISAMLFYTAFKGIDMRLSPLFMVMYALSPITMEGTYWVSAASRIVIPLFFTALMLYFVVRFKDKYGIYGFILIWICNILSYGYYEQIALLSFVICIYFAIKIKDKKLLSIGTVNFILLAVYYLSFAGKGDNSSRFAVKNINEIISKVQSVASEIMQMWFGHGMRLNLVGFKRGFEALVSDASFLWLISMSILVLLVFGSMNRIKSFKIHAKNSERPKKIFLFFKNEKLMLGIILFTVVYIPFFLTGNVWLNFRNAVPAMLGLAIIVDAIVEKIFKTGEFKSFISAVLIIVFLIATVSEINDYMNVTRSDLVIVKNVAESVEPDTKNISVTLKKRGYGEQNAPFRDHIMSLTNSYYGICGAVRTLSGNPIVEVNCEFVDEREEH